MPGDQRMFAMTLSKSQIKMFCHGRERSFLSMAQYGDKSYLRDQHQFGPPWGILLTVKGIFGFICSFSTVVKEVAAFSLWFLLLEIIRARGTRT